ncbi:hypothetical protein, partial [Chloroflexus sp.]|uniref:hypothetical protein n=1 Tax=Chloroflexus sp. TaxID=1904827 RepID=UPI003C721616
MYQPSGIALKDVCLHIANLSYARCVTLAPYKYLDHLALAKSTTYHECGTNAIVSPVEAGWARQRRAPTGGLRCCGVGAHVGSRHAVT